MSVLAPDAAAPRFDRASDAVVPPVPPLGRARVPVVILPAAMPVPIFDPDKLAGVALDKFADVPTDSTDADIIWRLDMRDPDGIDRKSTRLNSSH